MQEVQGHVQEGEGGENRDDGQVHAQEEVNERERDKKLIEEESKKEM